jgi:hypothetical protein
VAAGGIPDGQKWRILATKAIATCASGEAKRCTSSFDALESKAPLEGLMDAKITAAILIAGQSPDTARELVKDMASSGASRVFHMLGDSDEAQSSASAGVFSDYLNGGG